MARKTICPGCEGEEMVVEIIPGPKTQQTCPDCKLALVDGRVINEPEEGTCSQRALEKLGICRDASALKKEVELDARLAQAKAAPKQ